MLGVGCSANMTSRAGKLISRCPLRGITNAPLDAVRWKWIFWGRRESTAKGRTIRKNNEEQGKQNQKQIRAHYHVCVLRGTLPGVKCPRVISDIR